MPLIAIVEDDATLSTLLTEVFELEGYTSVTCPRANGAMDTICTARADLILLDLRLEDRDSGWYLLQVLRGDPRTAHTPVIVYSCDTKALEHNAAWLEAEGIPTIRKPFKLDDLLGVIEECFPAQRESRARSSS